MPPDPIKPGQPAPPSVSDATQVPAAASPPSTTPEPSTGAPDATAPADAFATTPPPSAPATGTPRTMAGALFERDGNPSSYFVTREIEEAILPRLVGQHLPLHVSTRQLDDGTLFQMSLGRVEILPGIFRYTNLGDHYNLVDAEWNREKRGIHTWEDLKAFIDAVLLQSSDTHSIEIEIDQYNFPTLNPPPAFLEDVARDVSAKNRQLTLAVHGDPMEPPDLYHFSRQGLRLSRLEPTNTEVEDFWQSLEGGADSYLLQLTDPERDLLGALREAHTQQAGDNLGGYLDRVIRILASRPREVVPVDPQKKTEIFGLIEKLRKSIVANAANQIEKDTSKEPPAAVLYWNPVDTFLRKHPPNRSPGNCWYSIGAGQMISIFELTRKLMDRGALPLDFRLIADNRVHGGSYASVWEVNVRGTRRQLLGTADINNGHRRKIYVLNEHQRLEALLTYQPLAIYLNVKAGRLPRILDENLLRVLKAFNNAPAVVTPAKAYGNESPLLYLDLYSRLQEIDAHLAGRLVVMGGYFEAPWMLGNKKVDITLAAGKMEGLEIIARGLSPTLVEASTSRADWEFANVKLIPNRDLAAALMAGGANKNFLTYRSARRVLHAIFELPPDPSAGDKEPVERLLEAEKENNIRVGEEITARIVNSYGITTYHLWSPEGLVQDFRNCLPRDVEGLLVIKHRVDDILGKRNLEGLVELLEDVRLKLGGGTRNARDGYLDEILSYVYQRLSASGHLVDVSFAQYYATYYPEKWKGEGAQEGRNGIGPLVFFATRKGITLPPEVYEAWNEYHPEAPISVIPGEQARPYDPGESPLNPLWGLPTEWLNRLHKSAVAINRTMSTAIMRGLGITNDLILSGLQHMKKVLDDLSDDNGTYVEVTRRLMSANEGIEFLIRLFENPISEDRRSEAVKAFRETVQYVIQTMEETPASVTELLSRLREVNIRLYRVELAIEKELKRKLGLGDDRIPVAVPSPARASRRSGSITIPRGVDVVRAGTVEEPDTGGNGNDPKALGSMVIMAGGAYMAGGEKEVSPLEMGRYQFDGTAALAVIPDEAPQTLPPPRKRPYLRLVGGSEVLAKPTLRLVSGESGEEEMESDVGSKKKNAKKPVRPNATLPVQNQARVLPFRSVLIGR